MLSSWTGTSNVERVAPGKSREPGEISVGGMELTLVLDGNRGKMCVSREIAAHAKDTEQALEYREVAWPRVDGFDVRPAQPRTDMTHRLLGFERRDEHGPMGHEANETQARHPWQRYELIGVEQIFPPLLRPVMVRRPATVGVYEQIDVGKNHFPPRCLWTKSSAAS